ncbi:MAG: GDP-mannose 4,6-dehydratase, partial [Candidatus Omnitrophica bacterium]|nr:GDP-mannose 4,6-dehydratase [Candidatus Omnitrophota bacterium]
MKIVVTGGAGFIGSHFIRYLLKKYPDCQILNIDRLTYAGNIHNLDDVSSDRRYCFVQEDICHQKEMTTLLRDWDILVNFAAETHVDRSLVNPEAFIRTDVLGVFSLLRSAYQCKLRKFIQISTDEVYGSVSQGRLKETRLLSPSNPYAASKAAADLLALSYWKS